MFHQKQNINKKKENIFFSKKNYNQIKILELKKYNERNFFKNQKDSEQQILAGRKRRGNLNIGQLILYSLRNRKKKEN